MVYFLALTIWYCIWSGTCGKSWRWRWRGRWSERYRSKYLDRPPGLCTATLCSTITRMLFLTSTCVREFLKWDEGENDDDENRLGECCLMLLKFEACQCKSQTLSGNSRFEITIQNAIHPSGRQKFSDICDQVAITTDDPRRIDYHFIDPWRISISLVFSTHFGGSISDPVLKI